MISRKRLCWIVAVLGLFVIALAFTVSPAQAQRGKRPQKIESTDPALRLEGYVKHLEMTESSPFKEETWYHIGPKNVSG
ncbi:MAG: hypothetical protein JSV17_11810, partial [Candidatus Aminicenantes bacterium]